MNRQARVIIAGLGVLVVVLGVALAVVWARDQSDSMPRMNSGNAGYLGMMQSMGQMDSDQMLAMMQSVLGPEGYQRMLDHIAEHRQDGQMRPDPATDNMMHRMMDGMMQEMPADQNNIMPMMPR